jgi:hypothetical protein
MLGLLTALVHDRALLELERNVGPVDRRRVIGLVAISGPELCLVHTRLVGSPIIVGLVKSARPAAPWSGEHSGSDAA